MSTPEIFARLQRELDRRDLPYAVQDEIFVLHRDGFNFLMRVATAPESTSRQVINSLRLAFRMRGWGDREALVDRLVTFAAHQNAEIRNAAVTLLVGVAKLAGAYEFERSPSLEAPKLETALTAAMNLGLDAPTTALVRDVIQPSTSRRPSPETESQS